MIIQVIFSTIGIKVGFTRIRTIRGNIIGDDSYFDRVSYAPGWAWDDMIYSYSAQVSSLSIFDNKVDITIEQGEAPGKPAKITLNPENTYVRIINNVRTVSDSEVTSVTPIRNPIKYYRALRNNILKLFAT